MEKKHSPLDDAFDENVIHETVFVRKDGKLRMLRRKAKALPETPRIEKPLFPISKERR